MSVGQPDGIAYSTRSISFKTSPHHIRPTKKNRRGKIYLVTRIRPSIREMQIKVNTQPSSLCTRRKLGVVRQVILPARRVDPYALPYRVDATRLQDRLEGLSRSRGGLEGCAGGFDDGG